MGRWTGLIVILGLASCGAPADPGAGEYATTAKSGVPRVCPAPQAIGNLSVLENDHPTILDYGIINWHQDYGDSPDKRQGCKYQYWTVEKTMPPVHRGGELPGPKATWNFEWPFDARLLHADFELWVYIPKPSSREPTQRATVTYLFSDGANYLNSAEIDQQVSEPQWVLLAHMPQGLPPRKVQLSAAIDDDLGAASVVAGPIQVRYK